MKSDTDLIGEALVESAKKRTSTGQIDAVTHNIGVQFGRRGIESAQYGRFDLGYRFLYAMSDILISYRSLHR